MRFPNIPTIVTSRLRLRKLTLEDTEDYYRHLFGSEAVSRYMLWNPHRDISESAASIRKALARYKEGRCYRFAIALKETDSLIGIIELLRFDEEMGTCSFAYMIGDAFWGRGYGTQALKAALDFGFEQMGLNAVEADHMDANPASGAVMCKAGMAYLRTDEGKYEKNGTIHDAHVYRITREMWKNQIS